LRLGVVSVGGIFGAQPSMLNAFLSSVGGYVVPPFFWRLPNQV
jgi:hypothetical protein